MTGEEPKRGKGKKQMRIGLRAKFGFFFLIFGIFMMAAIWTVVDLFASKIFYDRYTDSIGKIADVCAYTLDLTPEELRRYGETGVVDARYREVLQQMKKICELYGLAYFYIIYPTSENTAVWLFDTAEDEEALGAPVTNYMAEASETVREVYLTGKKNDSLDTTDNEYGKVVSVYYPLKDEEGDTIAVLGVDVFTEEIDGVLGGSLRPVAIQLVAVTVTGMLCLMVFVQVCVVHSINRLKQGVQRMANGELGVCVECRRRDEIGEITATFNRMSDVIKRHIEEMDRLNCAYQKLIPSETFALLHKKSVIEIRRGDQAEAELTVMSMEPCGFKETVKRMSAEETFAYINGILEKIVPAVVSKGGIIEQFDKAGTRSFYINSAEYALQSAILARDGAAHMDTHLAVGIAQGKVMVGIAGTEERMNIISISEQKKLSDFLMELAEKYHVGILLGRSTAEQIAGIKESYHCRFLGYIKITSTERLEGVVEVFDGDEPRERRYKQMTKEMFEQGVSLFGAGNYREARQAFIEVLRQYRKDAVAREYLYLCSRYLEEGITAGDVWFETL